MVGQKSASSGPAATAEASVAVEPRARRNPGASIAQMTTEFHPVNGSVVILAKHHNVNAIDPNFLVDSGIVPASWSVENSLLHPLQCTIVYRTSARPEGHEQPDQGAPLKVEITKDRFLVEESAESENRLAVASAYVQRFPHLTYGALGLNVRLAIDVEKPDEWLRRRMVPSFGEEYTVTELKVQRVMASGVALNVTMNAGRGESSDGHTIDLVMFDCNLHHEPPTVADQIVEALQQCAGSAQISRRSFREAAGGRLTC